MDVNKKLTVCNMKVDVVNYLKQRTVCKSCYNKNRRKNNNNTSNQNQKSKVLITITMTNEPQTLGEILEFLKVLEPRIPRSRAP